MVPATLQDSHVAAYHLPDRESDAAEPLSRIGDVSHSEVVILVYCEAGLKSTFELLACSVVVQYARHAPAAVSPFLMSQSYPFMSTARHHRQALKVSLAMSEGVL